MCSPGLSMAQNCVPVHCDLQQVWLWPHTECTLGIHVASSCSVVCAGGSTEWLAEGYQHLLKATSTFHAGSRRKELSSSQLSVAPGRHFCAAGTTNGKYRNAGHSLWPRTVTQLLLPSRKLDYDGKVYYKDCHRCHWKNLKGHQTLVFRQLSWCWSLYAPESQTPLGFLGLLHVSELLHCNVPGKGTRRHLHWLWYSCIMSARALK